MEVRYYPICAIKFTLLQRTCWQLVENGLDVHKEAGPGAVRSSRSMRASYGGTGYAQERVSLRRVLEEETRWR